MAVHSISDGAAAWLPSYLSGVGKWLEIGVLYALILLIGVALATLFERGMALLLPFPPADEKTAGSGKESTKEKELGGPQDQSQETPASRPSASASSCFRVRAREALESVFGNSLINFLHPFTVFAGVNLGGLAGSVLLFLGVYDFGRSQPFKNEPLEWYLMHLHHLGALFAIWGNYYCASSECRQAAWRDSLLFGHLWLIHGLGFFLKHVLPRIPLNCLRRSTSSLERHENKERSCGVEVGKHLYAALTVYVFHAVLNHEHALPYQTPAVALMCTGRYGITENAKRHTWMRRIEFPGFLAVVVAKTFGVGFGEAATVVFGLAVCVATHRVLVFDKNRKFTEASGVAGPLTTRIARRNHAAVAKFLKGVKAEVFPPEENISKELRESRELSKKLGKDFYNYLKRWKTNFPIRPTAQEEQEQSRRGAEIEHDGEGDLKMTMWERWPVHGAALLHDLPKLEQLLYGVDERAQGSTIDSLCLDWGALSPLAFVAWNPDSDAVVFFLLERGADPYRHFKHEDVMCPARDAEKEKERAKELQEFALRNQAQCEPCVCWAPIDIIFYCRKNDFRKGRLGACEDFWMRYHRVVLESCGLAAEEVWARPTPLWKRVVAVVKDL
eukprot:g6932.t1